MIAIIDYGMGNLRSVQKALEKVGADARVTGNPDDLAQADKIVLPGVGAIAPAVSRLEDIGMIPAIHTAVDAGKPFLGICLGFQLLFENSVEGGDTVQALGLIKGDVIRFSNEVKVPHMGWNQLTLQQPDCPLWHNLPEKASVYFCHSYYARPSQPVDTAALTDYGRPFASAVWKKNIFGVQFHPEKSQETGLTMLTNFARI